MVFLADRFGIPREQAGIFVTIFTMGTTAGTFVIGRLLDRMNARAVVWTGVVGLAVGGLIMSAAQSVVAAASAGLVFGLGFGSMLVCVNVLVARIYAPRAAPQLNALSVSFSVGGMLGPEITSAILARAEVTTAFLAAGAAALLLLPFMLRVDVPPPMKTAHRSSHRETAVSLASLWMFAAFFLLYTGAEIGFSSWIFTQMHFAAGLPQIEAARAVSLFWIGMMVGRLIAIPLTRRVADELVLVGTTTLFSIAVALLLLFPQNDRIGLVSVFAFGLFAGPVFSSALALVGRRFPQAAGRVAGLLLALGNLGVAIIPWLQGQVGRGENGGYIVTLIVGVILVLLSLGFVRDRLRFRRAPSVVE